MKKLDTFLKISPFFSLLLLSVFASTSSFAQCGGVQQSFDDPLTGSAGFTGSFNYGTGALVKNRVFKSAIYTVTSPTYQLPASSTSLGYGFTLGGTEIVTKVDVKIIYFSTFTDELTTFSLGQIVPNYGSATSVQICESTPLSNLPGFPDGGKYRLQLEISTSTGNGSASQTITFDDFRTTGTFSAIPLPVNFVSFDAKKMNGNVQLSWKVAGEENVVSYEVEKSSDGRRFSKIGTIGKTGQSEYFYTDASSTGDAFYRIKNVDGDGKFKYSTIARLKNGSSEIVFKAFPQPVQSTLTVQHPTVTDSKAAVTVSTADGRVVRTIVPSTGSMQTYVNMDDLRSGMYIVKFVGSDGAAQTAKIIKQ